VSIAHLFARTCCDGTDAACPDCGTEPFPLGERGVAIARLTADGRKAIKKSERAASRTAKAKRLRSATRPKHRFTKEFC
jgi:hypothetical protein